MYLILEYFPSTYLSENKSIFTIFESEFFSARAFETAATIGAQLSDVRFHWNFHG